MVRFGRLLALVAAVAVVSPVCGAMVSLVCQEACCCGEMVKINPCAGGECFTSVPVVAVSAVGFTVEKPVAAGLAAEPVDGEALLEKAQFARPVVRPAGHSPPDLFLENCSLLN